MRFDLDVVIDTDPAQPPFGESIGLAGQSLEVRPVEFLEQRAAGDAEPPHRPLLVKLVEQLADRSVEFGQAVEAAMAQPAQQPALDDQHRRLDFRFVARAARPGRQDRGLIMRRHLGVGAVDLRLVLITATLVLSGTSRLGTPPIASKARVWAPIQSASPCVQLASA